MGLRQKTFYIESYGCSANQSDAEIVLGLLSKAGLDPVETVEDANLLIINTCYVKQSTENKILGRITELAKKFPEKKMIISGCMPDAISSKLKKVAPNAILVSTNRINEIEKAVGLFLTGKETDLLGPSCKEKIGLPRLRKNESPAIIQICSGCLGNCSYCGTKISKGNLVSYSPEKITREIERELKEGCKEFWLTGQDIGCYGFDSGTSLPQLLKKILEVKGKYFVRLGMMNPNHVEKIIGPLLEACEDERIMKFFHIPIQSGSDNVLKDMNRGYKAEYFEKLVWTIRKKFPLCTIGTDIIVGYPTETENDFEETLKILRKAKPDWTNVSKFTSREGTFAQKLKPLDSAVVKKRSEIASKLAKEIQLKQTKKWVGWSGEVLVTQKGIGKNFAHRDISLDKNAEVGKFVNVRVAKLEGLKIKGNLSNV